MEPVTMYINGSCKGNPGPGGWAAIVVYKDKERTIEGNALSTTNNQMELKAVIEGLKLLKHKPCHVSVVTNSTYPVMTKEKYERLSAKADWPNKELWAELVHVCNKYKHHVSYKTENSETDSEKTKRCDKFAKREAELANSMLDTAILPGKSCRELIEKFMLEERRENFEKRIRKRKEVLNDEFSYCE